MTLTKRDHRRAKTLRSKARAGTLTRMERDELQRYTATTAGRGRPAAPVPGIEVEDAQVIEETKREPASTPPDAPNDWEEIPADEDDEWPDTDDDATGENADSGAGPRAPRIGIKRRRHDSECTIVNCPACLGRDTAKPQKCGKTGKPVWPPLGINAARTIAGTVFFCMGWVIKVIYRQDEVVPPTPLERDELANAIIEITRRRIGWVAAIDDILSACWPLGAYQSRARAANKTNALKPQNDTIPKASDHERADDRA